MAWRGDIFVEVVEEFASAGAFSSRDALAYESKILAERRAAAAQRMQNIRDGRLARGLCARCDEPRDPRSTRHCTKHHDENREATRERRSRRRGMRERMPDLRSGVTHHFTIIAKCNKLKCVAGRVGDHPCTRCGGTGVREIDGYLTCNTYADGRLGEIFIKIGKVGDEQAIYEQWAISASVALQFGVPVEAYFRKFLATQFEPAGATKNKSIPRCTSVLDYVARYVLLKFCSVEIATPSEVQP